MSAKILNESKARWEHRAAAPPLNWDRRGGDTAPYHFSRPFADIAHRYDFR